MDNFFISSTDHTHSYLPEYLAEYLGYYRDVDLNVKTDVPEVWTKVLKDINAGTHQAVCGGIWVPSIYVQHGVEQYRAFCKLASVCGMMVVAREPMPEPFDWKWFENKMIMQPAYGGASPYIWLQGCLKEGGADLSKIKFIHDFEGEMLLECFEKGDWGDVLFTGAYNAMRLEKEGKAHIVCKMGWRGGPTPWSVYYARKDALDRNPELFGRFSLAIQRAIDWIRVHDANDCRDLIAQKFPGQDIDICVNLINEYRACGVWGESILIGKDETDHYANYQVDVGTIDRVLDYDEIVDLRPYAYVQAQRSKSM